MDMWIVRRTVVGAAIALAGLLGQVDAAGANALEIGGKKSVTGEDVRRGLETLNMDAARLKALGLEGFAQPIKDNCEDHNGHHAAFIQQWDGAKWQKVSDWISPMQDKVRPALEADAKAYAEKNAPWPKRTEPCDAK